MLERERKRWEENMISAEVEGEEKKRENLDKGRTRAARGLRLLRRVLAQVRLGERVEVLHGALRLPAAHGPRREPVRERAGHFSIPPSAASGAFGDLPKQIRYSAVARSS